MPASRAARSARASAARAVFVRRRLRDPRNGELVSGPRRGQQGRRVELGEPPLGRVEAPDQEETPDLEMERMRGVRLIAVLIERRPRRVERLLRPGDVA